MKVDSVKTLHGQGVAIKFAMLLMKQCKTILEMGYLIIHAYFCDHMIGKFSSKFFTHWFQLSTNRLYWLIVMIKEKCQFLKTSPISMYTK